MDIRDAFGRPVGTSALLVPSKLLGYSYGTPMHPRAVQSAKHTTGVKLPVSFGRPPDCLHSRDSNAYMSATAVCFLRLFCHTVNAGVKGLNNA